MTAIVNEITGRDLRDLFAPMYNDQRRRRLLRKKPDVIDLCGRPRSQALIAKLSELRIQNPGVPSYVTDAFDDIADTPTVTLFLAKQGSDALSYVGEAVQDESRAMALQERFFQEVAPRAPMTMAQAIAELVEQPVYAEVLYADLRLGDHLYVPPGMELIAFVFPYDGGKLNPEGFTLLQWSSTGEQLEALVVHNAPPSTDAEREARRAHPGTIMPQARPCETTWWGVAGAAAMFTAGAAAAAGPNPSAFAVADLGDDALERLSSNPTIGDLIDLRIASLDLD